LPRQKAMWAGTKYEVSIIFLEKYSIIVDIDRDIDVYIYR